MTDFTGRRVLITGGAGDIGTAAAKKFLELGAKVVIVDLDPDALEAVQSAIGSAGELVSIQADVSDEADVERYVNEAVDALGGIDVFINNAGIEGHIAPLVELSVADFDRVIAVNLRGAFLGLRMVVPHLVAQGSGSVINLSSNAGLAGSPGLSPYSASKHALVGLTKTLALEVAETGVRVNSIHPSAVNSRMIRSIEAGGQKDRVRKSIPMGRYAEPIDIVNMMVFLASDESSFVTGSQYRVDGGAGAR